MTYQEALRKALACLRLAERGGTTDEAATAAAMAQQIITKYSLDISDIDFDQKRADEDKDPIQDFGYTDPLDTCSTKDYCQEIIGLARIVARHNQCEIGWRQVCAFVSGKNRCIAARYRIVGRAADVATARYLYGFYKQQVLNLVADHCKGNSYAFKRQFAGGVIFAVGEKLDAMEKQTFAQARQDQTGNSLALVRVDNAIARIEKRRNEVGIFAINLKKAYGSSNGGFQHTEGTGGRSVGLQVGRQNIRTSSARTALGGGNKQLH